MARPSEKDARGSGFGARGQSIIEYVLLITLLALVFLALRGRVETAVGNLYNASANKVDEAASKLSGM